MSGDRAMNHAWSEHLGKKGITIVARAPRVRLPKLADGSWHVVGGATPGRPDRMNPIEPDLIPFLLSQDGDVVLYRLPDDDTGKARPVLSRAGMDGRPPDLSAVQPFDPHLVRQITELQASIARAKAAAKPEPRPLTERRAPGGAVPWVGGCGVAGLALLLWAAFYVAMPSPRPGRWVPDMTNPRDVAITKGATMMVMQHQDDPDTFELYRMYPEGSGKGGRERVGTFARRDLERFKGELPDSHLEWRNDF